MELDFIHLFLEHIKHLWHEWQTIINPSFRVNVKKKKRKKAIQNRVQTTFSCISNIHLWAISSCYKSVTSFKKSRLKVKLNVGVKSCLSRSGAASTHSQCVRGARGSVTETGWIFHLQSSISLCGDCWTWLPAFLVMASLLHWQRDNQHRYISTPTLRARWRYRNRCCMIYFLIFHFSQTYYRHEVCYFVHRQS